MHDVIRLKQVDHVKNEKNILSEIHHPFIVDLLWFHKDKNLLYMLFPYVCGGELFSYLRRLLQITWLTRTIYGILKISANFRTRAIISRGLYIFYPIFHRSLYCRGVYNAERLIIHDSFLFILTFIRTASNSKQKIEKTQRLPYILLYILTNL